MSVPVTLLFVQYVYIGGSLVLEGKWVASLVELCSRLMSGNIFDAQGNLSQLPSGEFVLGFPKRTMICGNIGNYVASTKVVPLLDVVDPSPDATSRCC